MMMLQHKHVLNPFEIMGAIVTETEHKMYAHKDFTKLCTQIVVIACGYCISIRPLSKPAQSNSESRGSVGAYLGERQGSILGRSSVHRRATHRRTTMHTHNHS